MKPIKTTEKVSQKIELLQLNAILAELKANQGASLEEMVILNQIDSTNDYLLAQLKSGRRGNMACFAEQQTQGKGRRGRPWISPFGHNIYHSLLWSFTKDASEMAGLALASAVAVLEAIQEYLGLEIASPLALKWPNDIYYENKKLSGILLEMSAQAQDTCQVVIGVGINTHLPLEEGKKIKRAFTSLGEIQKEAPRRNQLAGILLNHLIDALHVFEKEGLAPFLKRWECYDYLKNREILVENQGKKIRGLMRGISDQGALLLETDGKIQAFLSGNTSVVLKP